MQEFHQPIVLTSRPPSLPGDSWPARILYSSGNHDMKRLMNFCFQCNIYRKNQMAIDHNRCRTLKKYFLHWCLWLRNEHLGRDLEQQQSKTKSKMAAFLEAAASGKLWTNRDEEEEACRDTNYGKNKASDRPDSVAQKLVGISSICSAYLSVVILCLKGQYRHDLSTLSNRAWNRYPSFRWTQWLKIDHDDIVPLTLTVPNPPISIRFCTHPRGSGLR